MTLCCSSPVSGLVGCDSRLGPDLFSLCVRNNWINNSHCCSAICVNVCSVLLTFCQTRIRLRSLASLFINLLQARAHLQIKHMNFILCSLMFMDYCWCKRSLMSENKKRHFNLSLFSQSTGLECFPVSGVRLSWTSYECEIKSCVKEAASKTTSLWVPLLHFCASFGFQIKNFSILKLNNLKNIVNCPLLLLFALLLTLFWSLVVFFVLFPLLMNFVAPFCPTGIWPMLSNFTVRLCAVSFLTLTPLYVIVWLRQTNWAINGTKMLTFFLKLS